MKRCVERRHTGSVEFTMSCSKKSRICALANWKNSGSNLSVHTSACAASGRCRPACSRRRLALVVGSGQQRHRNHATVAVLESRRGRRDTRNLGQASSLPLFQMLMTPLPMSHRGPGYGHPGVPAMINPRTRRRCQPRAAPRWSARSSPSALSSTTSAPPCASSKTVCIASDCHRPLHEVVVECHRVKLGRHPWVPSANAHGANAIHACG